MSRWVVMTSRGQNGRGWEELRPGERLEILLEFGDLGDLRRLYWRRES